MKAAIAVDLGATSGRFAAGQLIDGKIDFEIIEQIPHSAIERRGRVEWRIDELLSLCQRAVEYGGSQYDEATVGIDSWGVDHGFLGEDGELLAAPVCYRDVSHIRAFEALEKHRNRLYEITGIQHQPFNTLYQLYARRMEDPSLPQRAARWLIMPDLLGYLLSGDVNYELTQASTTQLLGLDDRWSEEACALAGWPIPDRQPELPGRLLGSVAPNVRLATVGSHDTASAVAGFGALREDQLFLNVGTWSLTGTVVPSPITTDEAAAAQFTNERTVDGRVRLLKNIPGFWVINRLHEELEIPVRVPEWLRSAEWAVEERFDMFHEDLFNPPSMLSACSSLMGSAPRTHAEWAGVALGSLTQAIAQQVPLLERITLRKFTSIRAGGGGSQSAAFCQSLANATGLTVLAGPAEATVLGNLGLQFLASGAIESWRELFEVLTNSAAVTPFEPNQS